MILYYIILYYIILYYIILYIILYYIILYYPPWGAGVGGAHPGRVDVPAFIGAGIPGLGLRELLP